MEATAAVKQGSISRWMLLHAVCYTDWMTAPSLSLRVYKVRHAQACEFARRVMHTISSISFTDRSPCYHNTAWRDKE
jgi:hypothetical protein